jgi:His Kinase A (phospho-acceptor) domain
MTSSLDSIYKKMAASDNQEPRLPEPAAPFDPEKHISPIIAHELNNILAIVQGYADRLILKYADDKALHSQLKMITEAARRAATIVRDATPPPAGQSQSASRPSNPKSEPSLA